MRSLSQQTDTELGGHRSILVRQRCDHDELERLLDAVLASTGRRQDEVLRRVARLVFPHAFAEEAVLWPALRRILPEGEALTLQVEVEHQEVNNLWWRLEGAGLSLEARQELIDRLVAVLRQDVRDEEDVLLPRLQESVRPRRLRALGVAWELVRRTAPTRPHPVVSRRPAGNVLAAVPLSVLDRGRDRLEAAAHRVPGLGHQLDLSSRVLARAALRVEAMPAVRHGENGRARHSAATLTGDRHA